MRRRARLLLLLPALGWVVQPLNSTTPEWAVAVFPSGAEFSLEIAADPESRRRGYMFRERVGSAEGMLFMFETSTRHGIWMKNCKVPLDIIWLDETFRVVDVVADFQPCPDQGDCPARQPIEVARYVLEVAGGTTEREGLKRGDVVVILSDPELR